jgi:hypothetical protein
LEDARGGTLPCHVPESGPTRSSPSLSTRTGQPLPGSDQWELVSL